MRVTVDHDKCQGHALCFGLDPENFPLDDLGYSAVDERVIPPGSEDNAQRAYQGCPERAISVHL
ncbi:ferredoxin [Parafrankia elaeagni]|uniref:ferredoxin n=1 Tax=Parafrankia elaeagni TaxID=222534 RepID=UPI00035F0C44|nr:ferredoxin [Parafrankia elaeagni]